jgi:hypothetical protein
MATTTSTVTGQQSIPTQLMPYFVGKGTEGKAGYIPGLLPKAQEIFSKDYAGTIGDELAASGLGGEGRVAGLSALQTQIGTELAGMQTPEQFGLGSTALGKATDIYGSLPQIKAQDLSQYQLGAGTDVTANTLQQYQMDKAGEFGADQASKYMSPYQQNVTDYAKDQALRDAQIRSVAQNLGSARQGTYGGARSLLAQTELDRNLQSQMQGLQYKGQQDAYTNAQQQFERDRAAAYQTNLANQQASLGVQQLGSAQSLEAQRANQAAQQARDLANQQAGLSVQQLGSAQALDAQKANQAAALQSAAGLGTLGATYGQLGVAEQAADIDRIKTQGAYGDLQRAVDQQGIDARYQDLMSRLGFPAEQLGNMANILRGVPVSQSSSTTATSTPAPSFASQLGGAGLTGLSLYNMFAGK